MPYTSARQYLHQIEQGLPVSLLNQRLSDTELSGAGVEPISSDRLPIIETAFFRLKRDDAELGLYARKVRAFENLSLSMRRILLSPKRVEADIRSADLAKTIRRLASADSHQSVCLEGVILDGDLDLTEIALHSDLTLKCCLIRGALLLRRSNIASIDIAGTIVENGIYANYVCTQRGVNLRRFVSTSVVDFGAATIGGSIDAADMIVVPRNLPSDEVNWTARKSIVNFARSSTGGDFRAHRSRIYGGLNLRAASVHGSVFLNDLIVRSPMATIEKLALDCLPSQGQQLTQRHYSLPSSVPDHVINAHKAELDLAHLVRRRDTPLSNRFADDSEAIELETLAHLRVPGIPYDAATLFSPREFHSTLLARLVFGNPSTQARAIGMERMTISGGIHANGMRVGGRLRGRNIEVNKRATFTGSHFRTFRSLRNGIREIESAAVSWGDHRTEKLCSEVLENLDGESLPDRNSNPTIEAPRFTGAEKRISDVQDRSTNPLLNVSSGRTLRRQYAVDFRESTFRSSVDFGKDNRNVTTRRVDSVLIKNIVKNLIQTNEDPIKFIQVFYSLPGSYRDRSHTSNARLQDYFKRVENAHDRITRVVLETPEREVYRFKERLSKNYQRLSRHVRGDPTHTVNPLKGPSMPRGRLARFDFDDCAQSKIIAACQSLGPVKSTLLIGEISFADSKIDGSLRFFGFIANLFERENLSSSRAILNLHNLVIKGDLDLRDTVGVTSIDAEQIKVHGSLRMSDPPEYDPTLDIFHPLKRRALATGLPSTSSIGLNSFNFERAVIDGDTTLVFDQGQGPSIKLSFARVGGRLNILPARGGLELNIAEIEHERFIAWRARNEGRFLQRRLVWPIKRVLAILLISPFAQENGDNNLTPRPWVSAMISKTNCTPKGNSTAAFSLKAFLKGVARRIISGFVDPSKSSPMFFARLTAFIRHWHGSYPSLADIRWRAAQPIPMIDLGSTKAEVFCHPPSAWPQQNGLIVQGMKYERSKDIGPLSAVRRRWDSIGRERLQNLIVIGICAIAFVAGTVWWPFDESSEFVLGQWNILYLKIVLFGLISQKFVRELTLPRSNPEALNYLARQRQSLSTNRSFAADRPHQPYIQAAKVLRSSGENVSADIVELERLRQRRRGLSWRTSGALKIILHITDLLSHYGFRPMRVVMFALVVHGIGSVAIHSAASACMVVASEGTPGPFSHSVRGSATISKSKGANYHTEVRTRSSDRIAREPPPNSSFSTSIDIERLDSTPVFSSHFRAPLFAADAMIPFLQLDAVNNWTFTESSVGGVSVDAAYDGCRPSQKVTIGINDQELRTIVPKKALLIPSWVQSLLWWVPSILEVVGLILTTIIMIAIISRIETIMARNEDT